MTVLSKYIGRFLNIHLTVDNKGDCFNVEESVHFDDMTKLLLFCEPGGVAKELVGFTTKVDEGPIKRFKKDMIYC